MNILTSASKEQTIVSRKSRVDLYDIVKGIGILLVVSAHIWQNALFQKIVYAFHMPLFLIVTGMLINLTNPFKKSFWKFLVSKFKSLMLPYIVTELICIPLYYWKGGYHVSDISWIVIDSAFLYMTKGLATWFLLGLFIAEIIYYLLVKYLRNQHLVMAISVLGFVISIIVPVSNRHLWLLIRSLHMMFFIMLGHQFSLFFQKKRGLVSNLSILTVFLVSALLNEEISVASLTCGNEVLYLLSSITGSALLITLSQYISKSNFKIVEHIKKHMILWGQETVIVLCTHLIFMRYGVDILLKAGPHYPFIPALLIFSCIMLLEYLLVISKRKIKATL